MKHLIKIILEHVERFLSLYDNMQNSAALVDVLLKSRSDDAKESYSSCSKLSLADIGRNIADKNALTWVQAAIATDPLPIQLASEGW